MKEFDIREFGAVGDGCSLNTVAIQSAIDECARQGGGRVIVSDGRYVTGTLFMRSCVELCIEANGVLLASTNGNDYPDFECKEWNTKAAPRSSAKCLIYFGYVENAALTGLGMIDCCGSAFCDPVYDDNGNVIKFERNTLNIPARMVFIMGCTNIRVEDITMKEMAGGWGYWVNNSQYVTFAKAKLYCNPMYPNADGIHINCSCDVLVDSCVIHSGDDCIIIRANTNTLNEKRICERVIVKGCVLSSRCQAIRIGWRNDGVVKNCMVSDIVVTDSKNGMKIELPMYSSPTDIGTNHTRLENIHINNAIFDVKKSPIRLTVYPGNLYDKIKNIRFSNITSTSGEYPLIQGRKDAVLEEIYFDNCKFMVNKEADHSVGFISNVIGLHLNNTTFDVLDV